MHAVGKFGVFCSFVPKYFVIKVITQVYVTHPDKKSFCYTKKVQKYAKYVPNDIREKSTLASIISRAGQ